MKNFKAVLLAGSVISLMAISCAKETIADSATTVTSGTLAKITNLGFDASKVIKVDNGYLVEGDILLTEDDLNQASSSPEMIIGEDEHYRTTNLVKNLPRTITVSTTGLPTVYITAAKDAVARYNALSLRLKFSFITSGTGAIQLVGFNQGPSGGYITLGSSGFPTSSGNPYNQIQMNTNAQAYGTNPNEPYLASVIAHEMGHCIGMRHTDYMNRAYSCGGSAYNEGTAGVGAIHIPGTPSGADPNSWMLACSNGSNRPFTTNDITGLKYLYQ